MTLRSNALIALKDLKVYLTIKKDAPVILLEKLIDSVSQDLQNRLGRDLVYTSYTDVKLNGNGRTRLYLPAWPIWSISALTEGGETRTENSDYFLKGTERDQGYLIKTAGGVTDEEGKIWEEGMNNIVVSYIAGYWVDTAPEEGDETEMPEDIQMAVAAQVGIMQKRFGKEDWDITAVSFPDGSMSKNISDMQHPLYTQILERYRRPVI